ncbi:MAG: cytidine deaminase [Bacteriovoracaceae bacterium]|nr:cytidine deaminase [Bacteriovoracaceae bacterium]
MDLKKKAFEAAQNSHSPYSMAKVGSALITEDGTLYSGCNIENSSFGGTVCAERVAMWKAVSEGHRSIKKIYVYTDAGWPPCGLCRQVMAEFASPDLEVVIGDKNGKEQIWKFKDLLPLAFTPEHLIKK